MFFLFGCFQEEERRVLLSFWTDESIALDQKEMVYINDVFLGDFTHGLENPDCHHPDLLEYTMKKAEDLHITVRHPSGDSTYIGYVNLYSVSTGIKIKTSEAGDIFVNQILDDTCTLIKINWW